jgi:hypothetical protein
VETNATLARSTRVIVLDSEASKDLYHSVVHAHRDRKLVLAQRITQEVSGGGIKAQVFSYFVELGLRDLK